MTQVTFQINNKKKWAAIKTILEAMDIAYDAQDSIKEVSEKEQALLRKAEADVVEDRLQAYKSHRDVLNR